MKVGDIVISKITGESRRILAINITETNTWITHEYVGNGTPYFSYWGIDKIIFYDTKQ